MSIVIATSSEPSSLPGIAVDEVRVVTFTAALSFSDVPKSMIVIGAAVIGLTGPMLISEAGTSFVDGLLGLFVLGGFWFIVGRDPKPKDAFFAALLIGFGFGLKSTGVIYAAGLALALAAAGGPRGLWFRRMVAAAGGGLLGWVVTGGWHALRLTLALGTPVWPYFSVAGTGDTRFVPEGIVEGLLYPWLIAIGEGPTSEIRFADPRWLLIIAMAMLLALSRLRPAAPEHGWLRDPRDARRMLAFLIGVWLLWIGLFGLERFIAPLEALSGLALLALIGSLRLPQRRMLALAVLLAGLIPALSRAPDLMRQDWSRPGHEADLGAIPPDATVILEPGRYAYLIPLMPDGVRVIGLNAAQLLPVTKALKTVSGEVFFLSATAVPSTQARLLLKLFWHSVSDDCRPLTTRHDRLFLCRAARDEHALDDLRSMFEKTPDFEYRFDIEIFRKSPDRANYLMPYALFHDFDQFYVVGGGIITVTYPRESCPAGMRLDLVVNGTRILAGLPPDTPTRFKIPASVRAPFELAVSIVDRTPGDRHRFDRKPCPGIRVTGFTLSDTRRTP